MSGQYIDDSALTEITILPDGRVYVFGLSEGVAEVLATLRSDAKRLAAVDQQGIEAEREGHSAKREVILIGDAREQR